MVPANGKPQGFDPARYITKLSRRTRTADGQWKTIELDYMEVKWRLLWLRTEQPQAKLETELVKHEGDLAIVRACVRLPSGAEATGWGSETADDWKDFIEKAETKAVGRALAALGFGTQFCEDFAADAVPSATAIDSPTEKRTSIASASTNGREPAASEKQIRALLDYAVKVTGASRDDCETALGKRYQTTIERLTTRQVNESIAALKERGTQSE